MSLQGWNRKTDSDALRRGFCWVPSQSTWGTWVLFKWFYRLVIRELKEFPISTGPFFLEFCSQIMLLFVPAVIWFKMKITIQTGPFYICITLDDVRCSWSKRNEKQIGTSPIEYNFSILSIIYLHLNDLNDLKLPGQGKRNTLLREQHNFTVCAVCRSPLLELDLYWSVVELMIYIHFNRIFNVFVLEVVPDM